MGDFLIGIPIGVAIGIAIGLNLGIIIGKKQKPWSELTNEEKRLRTIDVGVGSAFLFVGLIIFLWLLFS